MPKAGDEGPDGLEQWGRSQEGWEGGPLKRLPSTGNQSMYGDVLEQVS